MLILNQSYICVATGSYLSGNNGTVNICIKIKIKKKK